ncbi:DUF2283 domain-containing protein [Thermosulfurimonas sp. F29]|uniref:DUF2283 domain-containing protein n=1 Tax=Thermosulfurimonas sp. F29 TaxID=2867247 RepID=UPI001C8289A0|nr:DUF2283 domain-containing protein [Thermosulfurimonas sp. F29]MBX6423465.1 DUF2283 domain-containing protein [Thermosulfurimonas sp. F29]
MKIYYDDKYDLLYIRFSEIEKENVKNVEVMEDIILDIGKDDKIVGIEILNASEKVNLKDILPIRYFSERSDLLIENRDFG